MSTTTMTHLVCRIKPSTVALERHALLENVMREQRHKLPLLCSTYLQCDNLRTVAGRGAARIKLSPSAVVEIDERMQWLLPTHFEAISEEPVFLSRQFGEQRGADMVAVFTFRIEPCEEAMRVSLERFSDVPLAAMTMYAHRVGNARAASGRVSKKKAPAPPSSSSSSSSSQSNGRAQISAVQQRLRNEVFGAVVDGGTGAGIELYDRLCKREQPVTIEMLAHDLLARHAANAERTNRANVDDNNDTSATPDAMAVDRQPSPHEQRRLDDTARWRISVIGSNSFVLAMLCRGFVRRSFVRQCGRLIDMGDNKQFYMLTPDALTSTIEAAYYAPARRNVRAALLKPVSKGAADDDDDDDTDDDPVTIIGNTRQEPIVLGATADGGDDDDDDDDDIGFPTLGEEQPHALERQSTPSPPPPPVAAAAAAAVDDDDDEVPPMAAFVCPPDIDIVPQPLQRPPLQLPPVVLPPVQTAPNVSIRKRVLRPVHVLDLVRQMPLEKIDYDEASTSAEHLLSTLYGVCNYCEGDNDSITSSTQYQIQMYPRGHKAPATSSFAAAPGMRSVARADDYAALGLALVCLAVRVEQPMLDWLLYAEALRLEIADKADPYLAGIIEFTRRTREPPADSALRRLVLSLRMSIAKRIEQKNAAKKRPAAASKQ